MLSFSYSPFMNLSSFLKLIFKNMYHFSQRNWYSISFFTLKSSRTSVYKVIFLALLAPLITVVAYKYILFIFPFTVTCLPLVIVFAYLTYLTFLKVQCFLNPFPTVSLLVPFIFHWYPWLCLTFFPLISHWSK